MARRALELGFTSTIGVLHDGNGQLKPLSDTEQEIFEEVMALGKRSYSRFNQFQHNIARGKANEWRCRSGARYLYICEDGLVHWCSQQRGYPGIPLLQYTMDDFRREYQYRQALRAALHGLLLPAGVHAGQLARAADAASQRPPRCRKRRTSCNWAGPAPPTTTRAFPQFHTWQATEPQGLILDRFVPAEHGERVIYAYAAASPSLLVKRGRQAQSDG